MVLLVDVTLENAVWSIAMTLALLKVLALRGSFWKPYNLDP